MNPVRFYVDFNELLEENLVLFSKTDQKKDSNGNEFILYEGMPVKIYTDDLDDDVKWCCRINEHGITHESELK